MLVLAIGLAVMLLLLLLLRAVQRDSGRSWLTRHDPVYIVTVDFVRKTRRLDPNDAGVGM